MANLLQKASIVLTPTAYDNGKVLCAKPSEAPYGDFDFSRNSAATRVNAQGLVENVQILSSNLVQNGDFSEEGAEEVSNGSFSQEGVEIADNSTITNAGGSVMTKISPLNYNATSDGTGASIVRPRLFFNNITVGKSYRIRITPTNQSGAINFKLYNGAQYIITGNDLTTDIDFYFVAEGTNVFIAFDGTNIFNVDFEISLKEVGQDWTLGTGWSIGDGVAHRDGSATNSNIEQVGVLDIGKTYKLTYTVQDYVTGTIRFRAALVSGISRTANGTYTEYITVAGTNFELQGLNGFEGSVTNISVKEVGQDWSVEDYGAVSASAVITPNTEGVKLEKTVSADWRSSFLVQPISYTVGSKYKVTFKLKNGNLPSGGSVYVRAAYDSSSQNIASALSLANDWVEYIYYFTADSNSEDISFGEVNWQNAGVGQYFYIDDVSVIEITDDTNLPRINYEGFSYQDALGSELVTNGDFATDLSGWTNITNVTWSSNFGGSAFMNAVGTNAQFRQTISYEVGKTYRISWEVKENNGCDFFRVYNNNSYTNITDNYIGTHYFDFTHTSGLNFILRNDRVGSDITIDNVSVKEYLGQEVVPDSGCGSWLFEPQSTNLIPYSEDFSDSSWIVQSGITITTNTTDTISPSGLNNANKVVSTDNTRGFYSIPASTTNDVTRTIYLKGSVGGESVTFKDGGGFGGSVTHTLTTEWARYEFKTTNDGNIYKGLYVDDISVGTIYAWGAQFEEQSYATSYIPTSGSTVTRNQDLCTNGGSLATINSTEGVLYAEIAALSASSGIRYITLSDGINNSNAIRIYYEQSNNVYFQKYVNGTRTTNILTSSLVKTDFNKIAIRYNSTEFSVFVNGVNILNNADTNIIAPNTLNKLGFVLGTNILPFFGKTKALAVWKEALSDSELQSLTTI